MWSKYIKQETGMVIDKFFDSEEKQEQGRELTLDYSKEDNVIVKIHIYKKEKENAK